MKEGTRRSQTNASKSSRPKIEIASRNLALCARQKRCIALLRSAATPHDEYANAEKRCNNANAACDNHGERLALQSNGRFRWHIRRFLRHTGCAALRDLLGKVRCDCRRSNADARLRAIPRLAQALAVRASCGAAAIRAAEDAARAICVDLARQRARELRAIGAITRLAHALATDAVCRATFGFAPK